MKNAKHTPGPWRLSETRDYAIEAVKDSFLIGHYEVSEDNEPQDLANANLIAAAPEMFEALENMLLRSKAQGMPTDSITAAAEAAIKKARGER